MNSAFAVTTRSTRDRRSELFRSRGIVRSEEVCSFAPASQRNRQAPPFLDRRLARWRLAATPTRRITCSAPDCLWPSTSGSETPNGEWGGLALWRPQSPCPASRRRAIHRGMRLAPSLSHQGRGLPHEIHDDSARGLRGQRRARRRRPQTRSTAPASQDQGVVTAEAAPRTPTTGQTQEARF